MTTLEFSEDGTYQLTYSARWGIAAGTGVTVTEQGKYSLSGEVLLLEPRVTQQSDIKNNTVVNHGKIANENHVYITRVEEKSRLHVAGRCAKYRVDPICTTDAANWHTLQAELRLLRWGS